MAYRIHLFGASGSGTTTLGRALAERLGIAHFDSDNFYWQPSEQPFSCKRPRDERIRLLREQLTGHDSWILSGSLCGWGDALIPAFTHAIFVRLDPEVRLQRLRWREFQRYGARIYPGGERFLATQTFLDWAAGYDTGDHGTRSLKRHETWIKELGCSLLRVDSTHYPVEALVDRVIEELDRASIAR
ncbi:AAA family ATPase [Pseudomonas gingeri]|uniref:AAA family ATPase n=1 Tax=Pseudomonas gingeri TaxID=117681 RepID=UPI0015BA6820|nr:AAA family ATPase [Pseudomonas gingeri]NWE69611.1 AAA family ATPase [Pseudomonas gingeri]